MRERRPQLTLDTNLLMELWKRQSKTRVVEGLIKLAVEKNIDLAVTARIREDVPRPPLSSMLNRLSELGIEETGSGTRLGYWVLGRDQLGSDGFEAFISTASELARERGVRLPDWRDWDHLHAHMLQGREVFLTWDQGILCLAPELQEEFGIRVLAPEEWLRGSGSSGSGS